MRGWWVYDVFNQIDGNVQCIWEYGTLMNQYSFEVGAWETSLIWPLKICSLLFLIVVGKGICGLMGVLPNVVAINGRGTICNLICWICDGVDEIIVCIHEPL